MNKIWLKRFILNAIKEDRGDGDHTSLAIIPRNHKGKAQLIVKEDCVICGLAVAREVFKQLDKKTKIKYLVNEGALVKKGNIAFTVECRSQALLVAERLVLNIMQRLSGIASQTHIYVSKLDGLDTRILDTRKTTPGMRVLDKYAVKIGGGMNHRIGLYDMILIKDNHIDFAGGNKEAIERTVKYLKTKKKKLKIVMEARSMNDIKEIIACGHVHRILLDNFSPTQTLEAIQFINGRVDTESSGNITLDNIRDYAVCGVNYISVGALTHQIKSVDLSLKAIKE